MLDQKNLKTYLTFDDVLLLPGYSDVLPNEVDIATRLTREINLNCPLVSSPMDTVTEDNLAIALAQEGGIGIIHRNLHPDIQRKMVDRVKRSVSAMIPDPITMHPDQKIHEALEVMGKYNISGIPITNEKKLVGILTNRDLRFETDLEQSIRSLMTKDDLVTIPEGTALEKSKRLLHNNRIEKLLVVNGEGTLKGLITIKDIEKAGQYPKAAKDSKGRLLVGAALGVAKSPLGGGHVISQKAVGGGGQQRSITKELHDSWRTGQFSHDGSIQHAPDVNALLISWRSGHNELLVGRKRNGRDAIGVTV